MQNQIRRVSPKFLKTRDGMEPSPAKSADHPVMKKKSVDFCWFLLPIEILKQMACALHRPFAQKNVGGADKEQTEGAMNILFLLVVLLSRGFDASVCHT